MLLTEDEVLMGYRHWSKYQCKIFNSVDLSSGVCGHCVVDRNPHINIDLQQYSILL